MEKTAPKGNLTVGNPAKTLLAFTLPFLLSNAAQLIYSFSDTAVVGRFLGTEPMAAIGSVGIIGWPFSFISGAMAACSALLAQHIGGGRHKEYRQVFYNMLLWVVGMSVLFGTVLLTFLRPILVLYRVPAELLDTACRYGRWIVLTQVVSVLQNLFNVSLTTSGNSKAPLFLYLLSGGLNLFLNFVFIGIFGWGAPSAGATTAIATTTSLILTSYVALRSLPALTPQSGEHLLSRKGIWGLQNRILPLGLTNFLTQTGMMVLSFCKNGLGTEYIVGANLGSTILNFIIFPIIALGNAVAVFVAQNYGACEDKRMRQGLRFSYIATFSWITVGGVLLLLCGRPLMTAMVSGEGSAAAVENAFLYLLVNLPACFILAIVTIQKFSVQALGRRLSPLTGGIGEVITKMAASLLLTALIGYMGVCLANPISWLGAGIPIFVDYILLMRRFRKLEDEPKAELAESPL